MSNKQKTDTPSSASSAKAKDPENRLYPEDQAKVDAFLSSGVNSVERKPFRPLRLLLVLIAIVIGISFFSQQLPRWAGIY
ncbi:DUF3094 family protein [Parahaliea sp. F7430]|uniref:DUF3094 family protein n=1 Tax=Sediminihaliea albiluteola TaxID=2758564 RepID=A0A7W2TXV7_9GAMM|nr:DUF3094 family protein [Sediminihaliea albiluteola]MBA6413967.1 DUF3094 family protein [Sediminihaliea albiluteola]